MNQSGRMVVSISDSQSREVATVVVEEGRVALQGEFPGGLTDADLSSIGFVHYDTDERGEVIARVKEVAPAESLEYVRALFDALPPGYHISNVDSEKVHQERLRKRARFEEELTLMDQESE
ncbi:MAG: hypothetical protein AB1758_25445 [Candidatus Eremiobacterota bacterium]